LHSVRNPEKGLDFSKALPVPALTRIAGERKLGRSRAFLSQPRTQEAVAANESFDEAAELSF
jgi:hypothetical protein